MSLGLLIPKELEGEVLEAYQHQKKTVSDISRELEVRLGWNFDTAKYRVNRILQRNGVEVDPRPHSKMFHQ